MGDGRDDPQSLLRGLRVAVAGEARPLRIAARCLRDLGANVAESRPGSADPAERLWLGASDALPAAPSVVDLLLTDGSAVPPGLSAAAVVRHRSVSSSAANHGETLDERRLTAVGGVAVAVGEPDRPPLPLPEGCVDTLVGTHLAAAGVSALLDTTGETEVAAADAVAWAVATNLHLYLPYGLPWMRAGRRASGSGSCYPYSLFEAADGPFCLIGRTVRDWHALIDAMGHPAWARAPEFRDPRTVGRAYPERADAFVAPWVAERTRDELARELVARAFPCAPVLAPLEVLGLPYVADRWDRRAHGDRVVRTPGRIFEARSAAGDVPPRTVEDLVVLDLSWVWSGPMVSEALAELGATVIKVENAARADGSRLRGAPAGVDVSADDPDRLELSPYFHALNRGKRSVSLDLKTQAGRDRLFQLASRADVIVENLSSGVMERWGIAPEAVHEVNPGCVFLSMRGYRDHPAVAGLRAYAPALSSAAGIEALVAYPGEGPVGAMTIAFADALAASQGLLMALAGLLARTTRGHGAEIVLSQFEAAIFANGHNLVAAQLGAVAPLVPFDGDADEVARAGELTSSEWLSPELFAEVTPPRLPPVTVARLPWRRNGALPDLRGPGPRLGADSDAVFSDLESTGGATWIKA